MKITIHNHLPVKPPVRVPVRGGVTRAKDRKPVTRDRKQVLAADLKRMGVIRARDQDLRDPKTPEDIMEAYRRGLISANKRNDLMAKYGGMKAPPK